MSAQESLLEKALQRATHALMRVLPTRWSSDLGARVVRWNVTQNRPDIITRARANLRVHRPQASEAELDAMVEAFLDGVGRVMAEYAVMPRFLREGRIETVGLESFRAVVGTRPLIAFGLHTGNWETFGPLFQREGIALTSFYAPPSNTFERRIAEVSRARFGVDLLSPDARGARDALRVLGENRVVMIFPDEARDGQVMGPLFGRAPHERGNLAVAARLARHTGAGFVICHSERIAPCRFRLSFSPVFDLPAPGEQPNLMDDVAFLNSHIEPIVQRNIPRWYFLDDSIAPLVAAPVEEESAP